MPYSPSSNTDPFTGAFDRRKRRHSRYRIDLPVSVVVLGEQNYTRLNSHAKDLSESGIGLILAADLGAGEVVSLELSLPNVPEPFTMRAVVRYHSGCHYGLEFLTPSQERIAMLKAYCRESGVEAD